VNRPLLFLALLVFALIGLVPLALMLERLRPEHFSTVFESRNLALLGRTLLLGFGAAGLASLVGVPFAYLITRTRLPGADLWGALSVVPLLFPPLILAMSWAGLSDIRGGIATTALMALSTLPILVLFAARACERIDGRQLEAARLCGGVRAELGIVWAAIRPSVLCAAAFAFLFATNDFAVPDYVSSIGPKFNVYADEVFATWRSSQDTGRAVASALPLMALSLLALHLALRARASAAQGALASDFRARERLDLGWWKWPALLFVLAVLTIGVFAPVGRLIFESGGGARGFSLANMQAAFGRALELGRANLQTSLVCAGAAALLSIPLALLIGHALARSARLGRLGALAVVLPLSVPAILLGIGTIATWNRPLTADLYDSNGMVIVLMLARFLPFAVLVFAAGVALCDPRSEDAARLCGAGPLKRLVCIVAPPLLPALVGGATLVFVLAMREIDAAILVPAANGTILFRLYNAVHFGRDDFVAALALLVVFFVVLPGLLWSLFARRRLEFLP